MRSFLLFCVLVLAAPSAFSQAVASNVYSWPLSPVVRHPTYEERTFLSGITRDFSNLTVQAITLFANQPAHPAQELDEEVLLIIKAGELTLTIGEKRTQLGPGSIVLLMPGDAHRLENKSSQPLTYYQIRYMSNEMPDLDLYRLMGTSFWVDRKEMGRITPDNEGNRPIIDTGTIMAKRLTAHVTTLSPGSKAYSPHRHRAAEIVIVVEGAVQERIDETQQGVLAGDVIFLEPNTLHSLQKNSQEQCTYFVLQFE
ncbi:cupin domain-containing protein [Spirosoma taeanense]|uniref:Cupin domain-containing protein n=1 Tax=Spirosoma taeanense TaxID=2735870 RepID=A0A6M5YDC3_9BACT|nr:AraC family ligand binding domain-containing protein [Spirosoma taeanense]QJW92018.1 cupin domain-containing protein [Spirosoma taeanense]